MIIINHTHMIETGKFHLYLSTYSNEVATSVLQIPFCGEHQPSWFFLAPTKITFSSYYWMEAPTSTCTDSNLHKENKLFSLAPPYHPCFSDLNMFMKKNRYNNSYKLCSDLFQALLMHLGSPHFLCSGYSWKNSESSVILQSPLWRWSMHQLSVCGEHTLLFLSLILL